MYSTRNLLLAVAVFCGILVCCNLCLNAQPASGPEDIEAQAAESSGNRRPIVVPEDARTGTSESRSPVVKIEKEEVPYIGKITASRVYIRSGPAQVYYDVGQLSQGQFVVVREERHGVHSWARIDPTQQCFSWISKNYVELVRPASIPGTSHPAVSTVPVASTAPETETSGAATEAVAAADEGSASRRSESTRASEPVAASEAPVAGETQDAGSAMPTGATTSEQRTSVVSTAALSSLIGKQLVLGRVTGNHVRVRAGSAKVPPANANQVQTRLDRGAEVHILDERDDYYKIISPSGCSFWVSLDYIERTGAASSDLVEQIQTLQSVSMPGGLRVETVDDTDRKEYRELSHLLNAERSKPISQQDYADIRSRLTTLVQKTKNPSVKATAQSLERHLVRCEMGVALWKMSKRQDDQLRATLEKIDEEMELLVAVNPPVRKGAKEIVVQGRLDKSSVFTAPHSNQRFLVLDENEKIIYYAVSGKEGLDLTCWLDRRVSMVGQPDYDAFGKIRILKVTSLVEMPPLEMK